MDANHILHKSVYTVLSKKEKIKINRKPETASSDEEGRIYGIDRLKLGDASNELNSDSYWLLAHRRYFKTANKRNNMLSNNNECNVL